MKLAAFLVTFASFAALPGVAASIDAAVKDTRGAPLEDAVVWAIAKGAVPARPKRDAAIEQVNKQFAPLVTVVQAGTQVVFPNRDEIRHHVYSFSTPKTFEIKLYAGTLPAPVMFDKPGEVVLGCNIHDNMIAYLYVVETPFFAKAGKDGRARIEGLPAGDYDVHAWHYAQSATVDSKPARLRGEESAGAAFAITTKAQPLRPNPK